ncbi:hypothetical protein [Stieleria varia]|uniref:Uncharacterized protein n=1 Tax=Stieleria varia TaxID=2528005 RepID=A0A5C6ALW5_9BACT|nr:hypothetical protein [Stieleria varia]TWU01043.1 hypothetical protein Pla52n_44140 [Stieleria varia]
MYLKINCNLDFIDIALRLVPHASPDSLDHDSENVYEWIWLNIKDLPFALNVSREHGWADIDDEIESNASMDELKGIVKPGAVYMFGCERSTDSYINELPDWLPQFVADQLHADVFVYNGRINVEIPDGEPASVVHPQPVNANNKAVNGSRR